MTEEKKRKVEWSFSFENIGESVSSMLESLGISGDAEVNMASFSEAIGGAASAHVKLDMSVGEASVNALTGSDNLLEADVVYLGEVKLDVRSDGERKTVRLYQDIRSGLAIQPLKDLLASAATREQLRWDVRLSPDLPIDLEINTGLTSNALDLSKLKLTSLRVNSGTGKTTIALPAMEARYHARINGGTGELTLEIPSGADIDLDVGSGTGAININIGSNVALDGKISGGLGSCKIDMPGSAPVRLKASTGLGSINVPDHFVRVRGGVEFIASEGVWQTADYENAGRKITLKYSGGVGKLTVSAGPQIV